MRGYVLYFKKCPGVDIPRHIKVGITAIDSAHSRLASYQNASGPVWEESFIRIWVGNENQVRTAEKYFKSHFKDKISSKSAGLSEWICDITLDTMMDFVTELRQDYFIKLVDVPEQFVPLTMPLCEDLKAWYVDFVDTK